MQSVINIPDVHTNIQAWSLNLKRKIGLLRLGSNFSALEISRPRAMLISVSFHENRGHAVAQLVEALR
jgi:hypothetical protein